MLSKKLPFESLDSASTDNNLVSTDPTAYDGPLAVQKAAPRCRANDKRGLSLCRQRRLISKLPARRGCGCVCVETPLVRKRKVGIITWQRHDTARMYMVSHSHPRNSGGVTVAFARITQRSTTAITCLRQLTSTVVPGIIFVSSRLSRGVEL
jgi:hypothetical protein